MAGLTVSFIIFAWGGGEESRARSRLSGALLIKLRLLADVGEEVNCWGN